jgi:biopolymer transport protein ExbD
MPIGVPGYKPVHSRLQLVKRSRKTLAVALSLTAMVDLFTVLTVFLLQNYSVSGVALELNKEVVLPSAQMSEDLTPANVVTVTKEQIMVGTRTIVSVQDVRAQEKWLIQQVREELQNEIQIAKEKAIKKGTDSTGEYRNVTVQADRDIEFGVVKRVMFSATEAGAGEVNFAVLKQVDGE